MLPISIDISATVNEFNFSEADTKSMSNLILDDIQFKFMDKWERIVDQNLKQTADSYKSGMDALRPDDFSVVFVLEGKGKSKLGLMIEQGASPWDIKESFETSPKAKKKKDGGWYLTVPFPIATAEAAATSSVFSGQMKKELQNIIQSLPKGQSLNPTNVPRELQNIGARPEISNYPKYEHKTFDFQGLKHNEKKGHGSYVMFRRVSDKSDPDSWIHKGFEPHNFMEKALEEINIPKIVEEVGQQFIDSRE
jgi:hypothetical protein